MTDLISQLIAERYILGAQSCETFELVEMEELKAIAAGAILNDCSSLLFTLDHWLLESQMAGIADVGGYSKIFPDQSVLDWAKKAIARHRGNNRNLKNDWWYIRSQLPEQAIAVLIIKLIERTNGTT